MMSNRLCRALANINNPKSPFSHLELVTVREYINTNGGTYIDQINTAADFLDNSNAYDDPFYRIYGIYKEAIPKSRRFLSDFFDLKEAISFLYDLTGEDIKIISY